MASKVKPLNVFWHCRGLKNLISFKDGTHHVDGLYSNLYNSFCNMTESPKIDDSSSPTKPPKLPSWFKFPVEEKRCPNTIVMHALADSKKINEALKMYEKMKQRGCVLDCSFYSSLIFVLNKAGRHKDAREVLNDMSKQGVSPDVVTYNTMMTTTCGHSQEENALQLLREMDKNGCKPDLRTYAPLLKMCCRMKRMKVLSFLLNHMFENDFSLDLETYSLLVHGLCKSGELEHACVFYEAMVLRGFVPYDCLSDMLFKELEKMGMEKEKARIGELILQAW